MQIIQGGIFALPVYLQRLGCFDMGIKQLLEVAPRGFYGNTFFVPAIVVHALGNGHHDRFVLEYLRQCPHVFKLIALRKFRDEKQVAPEYLIASVRMGIGLPVEPIGKRIGIDDVVEFQFLLAGVS